ncbi:MAG: TonB-dependent receptor plug domain-containing protein [Saprospiraceae bacterium]|nr:TonB-dependent receptor plug domain-containing protein [Saprospiraceae bacterium]
MTKLTARKTLQFAYPPHLLSQPCIVSGTIEAENISQLFASIFGEKIATKTLNDNQILLREQYALQRPEVESEKTVTGYLVNEKNQAIPDVIVTDLATNQSTLSDESGFFELAVGGDSVLLQSIAHHPKIIPTDQHIDKIYLHEKPVELQPVLISEPIPFMRLTPEEFGMKMQQRSLPVSALNGIDRDVIKRNQLLPGVKADDDLSSEIRIRGSEGNETLVMIDGIPIYRSEHFYGIFSNINPNYIANSTLYKNGLPVQYGGKTGGMLHLNSHESRNNTFGVLEANLLYSALQTSIPLGKEWNLSIAGRKSYLNNSKHQVFDLVDNNTEFYQAATKNLTRDQLLNSDPRFNFYDVNTKLNFSPSKKVKFDISFFHSTDDFINSYDLTFLSRQQTREVTNSEIFRNNDAWSNTGLSLNGGIRINPQWSVQLNMYTTSYRDQSGVQSELMRRVNGQSSLVSFSNGQVNNIDDQAATMFFVNKAENHSIKIGASVQNLYSSFKVDTDTRTLLDGKDNGVVSGLFSEYSFGKQSFTWTLGTRTSYYSRTEKLYLDPSIRFQIKSTSPLIIKGSINRQHQFVRSLSYESRLTDVQDYFVLADGKRYPIGSSFNLMLGSTYYQKRWMVDLEIYHRRLNGVMEYALTTPGFQNPQSNQSPSRNINYRIFRGTGQVIGADLLIRYEHKKYQSALSYTLSESTQKFPAIRRSQTFPAQDDRRHQLQWLHTYRLGSFSLSGTSVFSSGRPYLDLTRIQEAEDRTTFSRNQFLSRLPAYVRFDLGLDYVFRIGGKKMTLGLSCFNILDRNNVKYLQYVYAIPTDGRVNSNAIVGTEAGLLNRTFNASARFEF